MSQAEVRTIEEIPRTMNEVRSSMEHFRQKMEERLGAAGRLKEETEQEERVSRGMLDAAKAAETAARVALGAAEATLAGLIAASVADPALVAEIPTAADAVCRCRQALEEAERHRELMEHRYELARRCLDLAGANMQQLETELRSLFFIADANAIKQMSRLALASGDLGGYSARTNNTYPDVYEKWEKYEVKKREPIRPDEIRARLNPGRGACMGLLAMLCATDERFFANVQKYRAAGRTDDIVLKIRKNMAGRLAEEIVRTALSPFGESVETQARTEFEDGTYTKTDLIVRGLVAPIILGRGAGMGAREGGSLAVEVKAGSGSYILGQKSHLIFQAKGHAECEVSCTICTHDIGNISSGAEDALRMVMHEAGSPLLGMLPFKSELDDICMEFVFGE